MRKTAILQGPIRQGHSNRAHCTKKISVSEVQLGMYISKLDRPWLETPFLMQGFLVETLDDIEVLADLCKHVWIDAVFEEWTKPTARAAGNTGSGYTVRYINKLPPQEEHRQAIGVYTSAKRKTKTLLDEVRFGGVVSTEAAKETVNDCVSSILRNPDALLWMSKMRNEDEHNAEHSLNVCILAIAFGRHLGFCEVELQNIGLCGLLHDVGKLRIPTELLYKKKSLSERDIRVLKAHPIYGRNLLMAAEGMFHGAIDVAYSHHERVDGTGYPRGLKSAGISQFSKMIAIIDAYDGMTANRHPTESLTCTDALKSIYHERGTRFDEKLALAFIKTVGLYPPGSIVELVNGEVALVLESNHRHHHLPKIITILDQNKQPGKKEKILSLERVHEGNLGKEYLIKKVHRDGSFGVFIKDYTEKGLQFSR